MVIHHFYKKVYTPELYNRPGRFRSVWVIGIPTLIGSYVGWRIGFRESEK